MSFVLLILTVWASCANGLTFSDPSSKCKVTFTFGYGYNEFYHILPGQGNNSFVLRFKVRSKSDAHILLSPIPNPIQTTPVYEIVLGAGGNTYSDIRRRQRSQTRATAKTQDIVSPIDMRGFWISYDHGLVKVGKEGDDLPVIFYTDPDPLIPHYFSFCTWGNAVGKWEFDCEPSKPESEPVQRELSPLEKLRSDLLSSYDPYSIPVGSYDEPTLVHVQLITHHVDVDEQRFVLILQGKLEMRWQDDKLNWDPTNYSGISTMRAADHEIWQPDIILYNNAGETSVDPLGNVLVRVTYSGSVFWDPPVKFEAFCNLDLKHWPLDVQTCSLHLGFSGQQDLIGFALLENGSQMSTGYTGTQWKITGLSAATEWIETSWQEVSDTTETSSFTVDISLRRQNLIHKIIFCLPLFAVGMIVLSSFWVSPHGSGKIIIGCFTLIIMAMLVVLLATIVPASLNHAPTIVLLYTSGMIMIVVSLMTSVIVICLTRYEHAHPVPSMLKDMLTGWTSYILCLPHTKEEMSMKYSTLDDCQGANESDNTRVGYSPPRDFQWHWFVLGMAIDRLTFLIYCVIFGVIFAQYM